MSDRKEQPVKAEEPLTREEVIEMMQKKSDFLVDLDNLTPSKHRWVDRGLVMSCEGGDHPPHPAFKRR